MAATKHRERPVDPAQLSPVYQPQSRVAHVFDRIDRVLSDPIIMSGREVDEIAAGEDIERGRTSMRQERIRRRELIEGTRMRWPLRGWIDVTIRLEPTVARRSKMTDQAILRDRVMPRTRLQVEADVADLAGVDRDPFTRMDACDQAEVTALRPELRVIATPLDHGTPLHLAARWREQLHARHRGPVDLFAAPPMQAKRSAVRIDAVDAQHGPSGDRAVLLLETNEVARRESARLRRMDLLVESSGLVEDHPSHVGSNEQLPCLESGAESVEKAVGDRLLHMPRALAPP